MLSPVPSSVWDAIDGTGLTYRMLDYWARTGYLEPESGDGSGSRRRWPQGEIDVAKDMLRLIRAGLTVSAAHRVARAGGSAFLASDVYVQIMAKAKGGAA